MTTLARDTRQKRAIRAALSNAGRPLSPSEVLSSAEQKVSGISIATVYRNLQTLVQEGWIIPVQLPGRPPHYEVAGKQHHHHFQCDHCSRVYELEGCDVEPRPKLPRGFRVTGHELFLYGTCSDCRKPAVMAKE